MDNSLIKRQDAIDAVKKYACNTQRIYEAVKALPSAQPDLSEYSDKLWRNAYERGKRDAQPEQRWIPCSETVDIPDHEIMACDKHGEMMFGYLAYEDEQWICESEHEVMYDPIAWEEKPEPYREEGEK